ncbi:hypothetical protein [Streptomyces herbicida]|uniref:hypothetical protein n=1 Tax=Streptomyces herbicida TaxID=3065675 RepID=UPI0029318DF2|nr:hypothetical protein [Streptomyces sp. NEAU-HV9]
MTPVTVMVFGVNQQRVKYVVGAALVLAVAVAVAVAGMLIRRRLDRRRGRPRTVRPVVPLLIGLVGGVVVGMTSVGSGSPIITTALGAVPTVGGRASAPTKSRAEEPKIEQAAA